MVTSTASLRIYVRSAALEATEVSGSRSWVQDRKVT